MRGTDKLCFDLLEKDYKFYLAFENSNCLDYITEKFWNNALMYAMNKSYFNWVLKYEFKGFSHLYSE